MIEEIGNALTAMIGWLGQAIAAVLDLNIGLPFDEMKIILYIIIAIITGIIGKKVYKKLKR